MQTTGAQVCVWNMDCRDVVFPPGYQMHLTVTSPPYWNAIDYEKALRPDEYHRDHAGDVASYQNYLSCMTSAFANILANTVPGGFCCVVIGTVLKQGKHYPLPFDFNHMMVNIGWEFHQDIVWHKCTAGKRRAGLYIQHPYPGYYYPNIMTEYVLVFRKPGPERLQGNANIGLPVDDVFKMDIANNVWHIAPVPPRSLQHPCPFPEEIPYRLIGMYSLADDWVCDPFCGSGQTIKVAHQMGRRAFGVDILKEYTDLTSMRVEEPLKLRKSQLVVRFDHVTSLV